MIPPCILSSIYRNSEEKIILESQSAIARIEDQLGNGRGAVFACAGDSAYPISYYMLKPYEVSKWSIVQCYIFTKQSYLTLRIQPIRGSGGTARHWADWERWPLRMSSVTTANGPVWMPQILKPRVLFIHRRPEESFRHIGYWTTHKACHQPKDSSFLWHAS